MHRADDFPHETSPATLKGLACELHANSSTLSLSWGFVLALRHTFSNPHTGGNGERICPVFVARNPAYFRSEALHHRTFSATVPS
jgi:hypothetical protein